MESSHPENVRRCTRLRENAPFDPLDEDLPEAPPHSIEERQYELSHSLTKVGLEVLLVSFEVYSLENRCCF